MQTLCVGGSGKAPGFLEVGMWVRSMWRVVMRVSFWSEGLYNSPCSQQPTESSRESIPPLGVLRVWESSKWMSLKCQTEPGTIKFCFASAFLATRSHFLVLAPYTLESKRQLCWHLHWGCELQAMTHRWQHKPAFCLLQNMLVTYGK